MLPCLCMAAGTEELAIESPAVTVKIDKRFGGAITWISQKHGPNLVNTCDHGRLVQQSYYAGSSLDRRAEGQSPFWSPWPWNPIQGGSFQGIPSVIEECAAAYGVLYCRLRPKLWDMSDETASAVMEQWTEFEPDMPDVIRVTARISCQRSSSDPWGKPELRHQELPACYFLRALNAVKIYQGNGSWTTCVYPHLSASGWGRVDPPRKTMALFLPNGSGIGIYSPRADTPWNVGATGDSRSMDPSSPDTMHVAPLASVALTHSASFTYRCWLILGNEQSIASRVEELTARHSEK